MIFAAILAGGIGSRINADKPKQFLMVGDKPILIHSIEKFLKVEEIDVILVSSPNNFIETTKRLICDYFGNESKIIVISGGKTRNDTILNSIKFVKENYEGNDHIMITHDAARIFVTPEIIKDSIFELKDYDAASAVIPAVDVIFKKDNQNKLIDIPLRENLSHAQTPQSFKIDKFLEIYDDLTDNEIKKLDEAMILFHLRNANIALFKGDSNNFKITRPIDLKIANELINK